MFGVPSEVVILLGVGGALLFVYIIAFLIPRYRQAVDRHSETRRK
jgi:hypothetical protein